jgi:hypothetical protein
MAGWRIGFAVGNPRLIAAMARVKSYLDYGAFTPIQAAAVAALNGPQDIVEKNRRLYHRRRDVLVDSFARCGWEIPSPSASMFAWAPLPPALRHMGSLEFSKELLTQAKVAVAAGVGYGEQGEGYVRIALVENEQRIRQAARSIKRYLLSKGVNVLLTRQTEMALFRGIGGRTALGSVDLAAGERGKFAAGEVRPLAASDGSLHRLCGKVRQRGSQKADQPFISNRRFSSKFPRRYAASVLSFTT